MKILKKLFFVVALGLLAALPAHAAILPPCATGPGVPQLSCFLELGVSISKWILGITGSLALFFFVYGGFVFLTSRGNASQVEKGKTILTQATIGIIIIFGAYLAVNFLVANVLKAKFTTEFKTEQPAAPAPKCDYCYCKDTILGNEVPSGTGTTIDACKTSCSQAQIGGKQGGYVFSRCGSPPSGQIPTTPSSVSSCLCACSNGYQEQITGGSNTYPAISECKSLCIIKGKGITMESCK